MAITHTSQLPVSSILSNAEEKEACQILINKISSQGENFSERYNGDLYSLLTPGQKYIHANGFKVFIQWLTMLMLKPENAQALYNRFDGSGPEFLNRLAGFFDGIAEDDRLYDFLNVVNLKAEYIDEIPRATFYALWKEHVNPNQSLLNIVAHEN